MNILKRENRKGDKIMFYYDFGRGAGQRPSTGVFIYKKPKDQIQRNHNKEALALLETKKSQAIIEKQAIGSSYIPSHKFKTNFLEYYEGYVEQNKRKRNRHLTNSLKQFKLFIKGDFIAPIHISENLLKHLESKKSNRNTLVKKAGRIFKTMSHLPEDRSIYYLFEECDDEWFYLLNIEHNMLSGVAPPFIEAAKKLKV